MSEHCTDRDVVLNRVIEGRASASDWRALRELAESDPAVWRDLEVMESQDSALCGAVAGAAEAARCVELPIESDVHRVLHARWGAARAWGGWIAAAAVIMAWSIGMPMGASEEMQGASIGPNMVRIDSPDDALRQYVDRGREAGFVVGLVPETQVVETRMLPDGGGVEILYVRQILERREVSHVYRLLEDEAGNVVPVQRSIVRPAGMSY